MKFSYRARDAQGRQQTGTIEADSEPAAVSLLRDRDWFTTGLQEQVERRSVREMITLGFARRLKKKELAMFFRELAVMLTSGVPVVRALFVISAQQKRPFAKKVILELSRLVQEGRSLSRAMAESPGTFTPFAINIVRSGESSGNIASSLSAIAENAEKESDLIGQLKQVMVYPAFVMAALVGVLFIVVTQLTPQLKTLIASSGGQVSGSIRATLAVYEFLSTGWPFLLGGFLALAAGIVWFLRTPAGKLLYDHWSLRLPVARTVLKKIFLARFCQNISALLGAGVSINQAFTITEGIMRNSEYRRMMQEMTREVSSGSRISETMAVRPTYFTPFIVQMVLVGEETGKLNQTMAEVTRFYQKDIQQAVDLFSKFLEPATIILVGIVVALLAFSLFSTIYGVIGSTPTS